MPASRIQKTRGPGTAGSGYRRSIFAVPRAWFMALVVLGAVYLGLASRSSGEKIAPPVYGYEIIRTYPHDPEAYTQGLVFHDGDLYESTGLYGRSSLRRVDLETGRVLLRTPLPSHYFGEGLTHWGNQWIQLTWQSRLALVYGEGTLRLIKKIPYPLEGWGLTQDGRSLIASDGSATLYFLDPESLKITRKVVVRDQGRPVPYLNELEYVQGAVYANVYLTDRIARLAPDTGEVTGWIDLTGLLPDRDRGPATDVLNGIAFDARQQRLFVTGKNWPKLFEIRPVKRL